MFLILFLATYLIVAFYLGWRAHWAFGGLLPPVLNRLASFWILFIALFAVFPIVYFHLGRNELASPTAQYLAACLFALLLIAFTTTAVIDIVCWVVRHLPWVKTLASGATEYFHTHRAVMGCLVILAVLLHFSYALYRADTPRMTYYPIHVDKPLGDPSIKKLRVVLISDTHITAWTSLKKYEKLVAKIDALHPDLVFIAGDIVDRGIAPFKRFAPVFKKLDARYGVYAILGNHEYYGGTPSEDVKIYDSAGMRLLRDQWIYLKEPGLTIVGRDDKSRGNSRLADSADPTSRTARLPLAELLAPVLKEHGNEPIFMMDHQPFHLEEAAANKVDVEFSGHTHDGQIFPVNWIVAAIYQNPWGVWKSGDFTSVVTCGVGTWGPPARFPSYSEYVVMDISFKDEG